RRWKRPPSSAAGSAARPQTPIRPRPSRNCGASTSGRATGGRQAAPRPPGPSRWRAGPGPTDLPPDRHLYWECVKRKEVGAVVTATGIRDLLEEGRYDDLKRACENIPAADAARMLLELTERQRALVFR